MAKGELYPLSGEEAPATPQHRRPERGFLLLRRVGAVVASVVGLLAIVGAALNGARFVANAGSAASLAMALLTGLAILSYVVALYLSAYRRRS